MKAIIIASGSCVDENIFYEIYAKDDFIICADGGLNYINKLGITPNVIVGDFDSVNLDILNLYKETEIHKFIKDKDYTDMEIAVEVAIKKGYKDLIIFGATGTRLDHTVTNILLIERYIYEGVNIEIIDNNNFIKVLNKNTVLKKRTGYYLSIVPITDSIEGLTLRGLKFPLDNVTVNRGSTLCISNEIIEEKAEIEIKNGVGILFLSKD